MYSKKLFMFVVLGTATLSLIPQLPSLAGETLKDKCSAAVSIPQNFDGNPGAQGAIVLVRQPGKEWTDWSQPFVVQLGSKGHVRWWCNSTIGNGILKSVNTVTPQLCEEAKEGLGGMCKKVADRWVPDPVTSEGWTREQSRCGDRSNKFRARLGPSRKLEMECLGKL
jgi:hypothetical protein